jgi:hypothetical protein
VSDNAGSNVALSWNSRTNRRSKESEDLADGEKPLPDDDRNEEIDVARGKYTL